MLLNLIKDGLFSVHVSKEKLCNCFLSIVKMFGENDYDFFLVLISIRPAYKKAFYLPWQTLLFRRTIIFWLRGILAFHFAILFVFEVAVYLGLKYL